MNDRCARAQAPRIRPLAPGDTRTIETVFAGLTPEQRQLRFHTAMPRLSSTMKRQLADVDGRSRVALVVELLGVPVGIGRYARVDGSRAELALAVVADYTGRGLGTLLLKALVRHAARAGIEELVFDAVGTNRAVLHMARSWGADLVLASSTAHGSLPIGPSYCADRAA